MLDLAFIIIVTAWSAGIGLRILDGFHAAPEATIDAMGLAIPLGLGSLALITLGLGEVALLNATAMTVVFGVGGLLGGRRFLRFLRSAADRFRFGRQFDRFDGAFLGLLLLTLLGTLLTALVPVTDGDALCYHLQVPKVFLWQGQVFFDPDLHETVYPLVTELLYAVGLMYRGPVACRLIAWILGLVFAANVSALARSVMGDRAWWAGVLALLVPAISNGMTAPLNDVTLAAFGTATLVAWLRFYDHPSFPNVLLAGICAGLSLGVKYPALVLLGIIGLAILVQGLLAAFAREKVENFPQDPLSGQGGSLASPWHFSMFAMAAVLVGGAWYLRAWLYTGNPVFPYFRHVFGGAGLDEVLDVTKRAMPVTFLNLLTVLGQMTLEPDRFDSFSHQFGPIFLWFLPALLWERAPRRVLKISAVGYGFLLLCVTQRQSMRFVLIALGPLSVGVAWLVESWWKRKSVPSRALVGLLLLALGFETTLALARVRNGLPALLGRESVPDYLARREPTFQVGAWVGEHLPAEARLIGQDHRGFYLPRPYAMELAHRRRTGLGKREGSAEAIAERLAHEGYTHLLLCPPVPEDAVEFDPTLGRLMASWLAERTPIYRKELKDGDGVVRRYAIYELGAPATVQVAERIRR